MNQASLEIQKWGFGESALEYQSAWDRQKAIHQEVVAGNHPSIIALLEHQSVYTAGRSTQDSDRPTNGSKVFDIDRGGRITWHGPGQLVGYPIMKLPDPIDIVAHVRRIEEMLISVLRDIDIKGEQISGRSGVWVTHGPIAKKIAAIGIRVAKRVSMHGFALNCNNDLSPFEAIVPCGISDAEVTSISQELGQDFSVSQVIPLVEKQILAGALLKKSTASVI